ncbi:hypothetical protein ACIA6D_35885 [Streptomyces cacaoi]
MAQDTRGEPVFCGDALADPLTGLFAAELALSAPENGRGRLFDVAMSQVVSATLAPAPGSTTGTARRVGAGAVVWSRPH